MQGDTTFPLDFLVHVKAFLGELSTFSCVLILLNMLRSRISLICWLLFGMCQSDGCFFCVSSPTAAVMAGMKLPLDLVREGGLRSHTWSHPDVTMVQLPLMESYKRPS